MDFGFTEEQNALGELAKKIFWGLASPGSLDSIDAEPERYHRGVWDALCQAELLGVALPESVGGSDMGFVALCLLCEKAGDAACPIPLVPTLVMGALPLAKFGTPAQQEKWLPPVVRGQQHLTAAFENSSYEPIEATRDGDGYTLSGSRQCVPALHLAAAVLVPATLKDSTTAVFVVRTDEEGVRTERQISTDDEPLGRLALEGVQVPATSMLGSPSQGQEIVRWALSRTQVAQAAVQLGLARRALIMTAKHAAERHQFDRPIGTFQAVSQRAGDAYVDVEVLRLAVWRAAWLLAEGRDAPEEVAVANIFAAESSHRVLAAAQHIHGGLGFDRDYPLHRYFLQSKRLEFTLGSASSHVAALGEMIAGGV